MICIPVSDPGDDGHEDHRSGRSGPVSCTSKGRKVPCDWAGGTWSNARGCYLIPTVQPPADSDAWQGNDPSRGRLANCDRPGGNGTPMYVFIAGAPVVDPGTLALNALDQLQLTVPEINTAPPATGMTYVGLRTWLWIPESQWKPLEKTVSVGGSSVTVHAEPRQILWDLGPGATTCGGPGREWISGHMSEDDTTSCGYTYRQVSDFEPDKRFPVTAAITFHVDWTCSLASDHTLMQ